MCTCFIVPRDVLTRISQDPRLPPEIRQAAANTVRIAHELRLLRIQALRLTSISTAIAAPVGELAAAPTVTVYDCKYSQTLPGTPVANPGGSAEATAKRAFDETSRVADFYKDVFGRNSIDNAGMTMMS